MSSGFLDYASLRSSMRRTPSFRRRLRRCGARAAMPNKGLRSHHLPRDQSTASFAVRCPGQPAASNPSAARCTSRTAGLEARRTQSKKVGLLRRPQCQLTRSSVRRPLLVLAAEPPALSRPRGLDTASDTRTTRAPTAFAGRPAERARWPHLHRRIHQLVKEGRFQDATAGRRSNVARTRCVSAKEDQPVRSHRQRTSDAEVEATSTRTGRLLFVAGRRCEAQRCDGFQTIRAMNSV